MKYLLILIVLVSVIRLGSSLQCYQNSLTPLNCKMKSVTCNNTERCFKRTGKIKKSMIASRGCIFPQLCKKSITTKFAGLTVTLKTFCCVKDFCNGTKERKLSLALGSALVLGWFICLQM